MKEEYLKESVPTSLAKVQVPKDRVWVMGDNRNNSADSRYHQAGEEFDGTISTQAIVGKAFSIIMPFSRMQILDRTEAFEKIKIIYLH